MLLLLGNAFKGRLIVEAEITRMDDVVGAR